MLSIDRDVLDDVSGGGRDLLYAAIQATDKANAQGVEWGKTAGGIGLEGGLVGAGLWGMRHGNIPKGIGKGLIGATVGGVGGFAAGYLAGFGTSLAKQAFGR